MTKLRTTIQFWVPPDADDTVAALSGAASALGASAEIGSRGAFSPATVAAWHHAAGNTAHQNVAEVRWRWLARAGELVGSVQWDPHSSGAMANTIGFDFSWSDGKRKTKATSKRPWLVLDNVQALLKALHVLAVAAHAKAVIVGPMREPPELLERRYARWQKLGPGYALSNLDWIFGLRSDDPQRPGCDRIDPPPAAVVEHDGFAVFAVAPAPLDLRAAGDLARLSAVEAAFGLGDP